MKYYTRNFYNSILPYYLIDEFTIYDEASICDDEFYKTLVIKKVNELKSYGIEYSIYSLFYTGSAVKLLSILPTTIEVADIRAFLLYAISPEHHKIITELKEKQNTMIENKHQEIENRYNEDKKMIPKHWLAIYDINWFDSVLKIIDGKENEITLIVEEGHYLKYTIQLKNVSIIYKEKAFEQVSRIIFAEMLYEESKFILNIMTYFNEYSFAVADISVDCTTIEY